MDLFEKLATNMEEMIGTFEMRMIQMESSLNKLSSTEQTPHKDLESLSLEFFDFKSQVSKAIEMMRSQLDLLTQEFDTQKTASRKNVLLFHGIAESAERHSTIVDTIYQLLSDQLQLFDVTPDQIYACHRLGSNTSTPRPVMVRFANHHIRNHVWKTKTSLRNTGITISEFLTKSRHDVFTAARKHFGMKHCWSSDGKIVILVPDNTRRRIETMSELNRLLLEFPAVQTQDKSDPSIQAGLSVREPKDIKSNPGPGTQQNK